MKYKLITIIIFLILLFYIINKYLYFNEYFNEYFTQNKNLNIDIVVARYNEDLIWTLEYPFNKYKYIVYNKGDNDNFFKENVKEIINLPNVGKCDHTYLNHVITKYDSLADITVFFPGSVNMKYKKKIAIKLLKEIEIRNNAVFISLNQYDIKKLHYNFKLNNWLTNNPANKLKNPEYILKKSLIRPYGLWFENMFGNLEVNCIIFYGIFSIDKRDILQHPVSRYNKVIKDISDHSNPEVGHYIERSWCAIFHPLKHTNIIRYNKI